MAEYSRIWQVARPSAIILPLPLKKSLPLGFIRNKAKLKINCIIELK